MNYPEDYNRSRLVAVEALEHMKKHKAPWNPLNFAIWYEYVAGRDTDLIQKIDGFIEADGALSPENTESVFLELFTPAPDKDAEKEAEPGESDGTGDVAVSATGAGGGAGRDDGLTDDLTGIPNARHFERALDGAVGDAAGGNSGLSLIIVDLDHFNEFSETYGHDAGDRILKFVADTLRQSTKDHDTAARLDGSTFAIIQPKTSIAGAYVSAVTIHNTIEKKQSVDKGLPAEASPLSASLGVAEYMKGETPGQLMQRAIAAVHQAKESGGNKVLRQDKMRIQALAS